jgi:hypothetical protein
MRLRLDAYALAATLLLLLLSSNQVALGQSTCSVQYGLGSKPMLFGGLYEAGRCTGFSGCQPRDDFWYVNENREVAKPLFKLCNMAATGYLLVPDSSSSSGSSSSSSNDVRSSKSCSAV